MPGDPFLAEPEQQSSLPPELEGKLRTCEAIVERMDVLQRQVEWEIQDLARSGSNEPTRFDIASPAIQSAVSGVLRWIRESVAVR